MYCVACPSVPFLWPLCCLSFCPVSFGHFEWFAALGQKTEVKKLADFVIEHYYPQCQGAQKYVQTTQNDQNEYG
jgi:uncharacterized protein YdiU (UPF0061 family)